MRVWMITDELARMLASQSRRPGVPVMMNRSSNRNHQISILRGRSLWRPIVVRSTVRCEANLA